MVPSSALVPLAEREVELGGGWKEASPPTVLSSLMCRGLCGPLIWSQMVLPVAWFMYLSAVPRCPC